MTKVRSERDPRAAGVGHLARFKNGRSAADAPKAQPALVSEGLDAVAPVVPEERCHPCCHV
jgi:hypothetical protein